MHHWDVLVTDHWDVVGCFIWDLFEMLRRHTDGTSLLCSQHDVPIRCCGEVPLRRLGDVPQRRCWVFHFRHKCDVTGMYRKTSLQCHYNILLPDGDDKLLTNKTNLFIFLQFYPFFIKLRLKSFQKTSSMRLKKWYNTNVELILNFKCDFLQF